MTLLPSRWHWPKFSIDQIRQRSRILVIDDDEFYYQTLFRDDGYQLDKWDDVTDRQKLESGFYDLLLLDIQGVGQSISSEQGLGVLRHLKLCCPTLLVIAYSNADYSLKYKEFFDLADMALAKTADYVDFKRAVDQLLKRRFSLEHYLETLDALVSDIAIETPKLNKLARKAIRTQETARLVRFLEDHGLEQQRITLALHIVQTATSIAALAVA